MYVCVLFRQIDDARRGPPAPVSSVQIYREGRPIELAKTGSIEREKVGEAAADFVKLQQTFRMEETEELVKDIDGKLRDRRRRKIHSNREI